MGEEEEVALLAPSGYGMQACHSGQATVCDAVAGAHRQAKTTAGCPFCSATREKGPIFRAPAARGWSFRPLAAGSAYG